jgi:hypothetical protein
MFGGKWETMEGRPGERNDEYLVGEIELDYSTKIDINGVNHFLISPNTKSEEKLDNILYSNNTEKLTKEEIKKLILAKPDIL